MTKQTDASEPVAQIVGDSQYAVIFDDGEVVHPEDTDEKHTWDGVDPDVPSIEATEIVDIVANHPDAIKTVAELYVERYPEDAVDMVELHTD